jgi:hypothetical protein
MRCLLNLLLLLIPGAAVSLAVAWACALGTGLRVNTQAAAFAGYGLETDPAGESSVIVAARYPCALLIVQYLEPSGSEQDMTEEITLRLAEGARRYEVPKWGRRILARDAESSTEPGTSCLAAFGWPALSMCAAYRQQHPDGEAEASGPIVVQGRSGIPLAESSQITQPPRALPLRPIWPGFIADSVLYAVILGVLWFGPHAIRRSVRIRRRRCPACGHPVGTTSRCAECGSRLPSSLRAVWEAHDRQRRAADEHDGKEGHHLSMPSLSTPRSREALLEADVILAVDIKSGAESIIYGRDFLKRIRREGLSKGGIVVRVEVHPDLDDVAKLCTAVHELRGHHEYRPPKPAKPIRPRRPKRT